jgi:DNA-binding MarR family transcriptional regulator
MSEAAPGITDRLIEDVTGLWRFVRLAAYPVHLEGMTPEQFWLLRYLERHSPVSIGALAEALGIKPSSATSACKRLEQAGLVTRTRQSSDERVVNVEITELGAAQLAQMRQRQREAVGRFLGVLDPQEQATLLQLLDRVLAACRESIEDEPCGPGGRRHLERHIERVRRGGWPHTSPMWEADRKVTDSDER